VSDLIRGWYRMDFQNGVVSIILETRGTVSLMLSSMVPYCTVATSIVFQLRPYRTVEHVYTICVGHHFSLLFDLAAQVRILSARERT
jgi:hypothetical protein